jgi:hypothetical protein
VTFGPVGSIAEPEATLSIEVGGGGSRSVYALGHRPSYRSRILLEGEDQLSDVSATH